MRALVSGEDVDAVLDARIDQVHDACRRLGADPDAAVAVVGEAALDLIDALARRPETVGDLVGGLFARALTLTPPDTRRPPAQSRSGQGPGGDEGVVAALARLEPRARLALLLRDAYSVSAEQAAVGLGLDVAGGARMVALARVALVESLDQRSVTDDSAHDSAHDIDIGDLGMLADDSAPRGGRFAVLRRHVSGCAGCAGVLAAQTRSRAMVSALPLLAMPTADRSATLRHAAARAAGALPSAERVAAELDGHARPLRLVPIPVVFLVLLLALGLGALTGTLIGHDGNKSLGPPPRPGGQPACSISATRKASSRDCPVFSRGSHAVS